MFENTALALDVLQALLERQKVTYALLEDDLSLREFGPNFQTFLNNPKVHFGQSAAEVFDALIGSEQVLQDIWNGIISEYRLEYVNFSPPNFPARYISLYIWPRQRASDRHFLLLVEDVTPAALLEQRAIQARNELYLLRAQLDQDNARLQCQAFYDALTELPNRRYLDDALRRYIEFSGRYLTPLSLMMMDIDDFKVLNDAFGHPAGDEGLRLLARVISESMRATDFAARYGGEEFCVFLPMLDAARARVFADRIQQTLDQRLAPFPWRFTISVGIAALTPGAASAVELIKLADDALYRAKREGKNRICVSETEK